MAAAPWLNPAAHAALQVAYVDKMPTVGENGVMLLMARRDMSSVPIAASLTVSCSEPSWPLRNSLTLCLPPLSRSPLLPRGGFDVQLSLVAHAIR